ncbi:MAG: peptide-methionine (S)-S-oxide reductase MsrA [Acidobacteria bacterium]|nr:peptide-methionine (S)-S-oxide reductase MsrA [Acidobacteriota bacterium]
MSAVATLAGGCFWCLEAVYQELDGVQSVVSGYMGGHVDNPTYQDVCTGSTGHAEVVQITYDESRLSFRDILEVFFAIHDPTTLNRQGNDVGTQYRSAIYCHNTEQETEARAIIEEFEKDGAFRAHLVTEVTPAESFWPAEKYHQSYFVNNPYQPYCMAVVSPKLSKFRQKFAAKRKAL